MKSLTTLMLLIISLHSFSQESEADKKLDTVTTMVTIPLGGTIGMMISQNALDEADETAKRLAEQGNYQYLLTPEQGMNKTLIKKEGLDNFIKQVKPGDVVVIEYLPDSLEQDIEDIKKKVQSDFINKQKANIANYRLEEERYLREMREANNQSARITARNNVNKVRGVIAYGESRIEDFKNFKDKEMLAMIDLEVAGATTRIEFPTDGNLKSKMKEVENFINDAAKNRRSIISVAKNADLGKIAQKKILAKGVAVASGTLAIGSMLKGAYDLGQGYRAADRNEELDNINNPEQGEGKVKSTTSKNVFGE